jgi:hypothetical protein
LAKYPKSAYYRNLKAILALEKEVLQEYLHELPQAKAVKLPGKLLVIQWDSIHPHAEATGLSAYYSAISY